MANSEPGDSLKRPSPGDHYSPNNRESFEDESGNSPAHRSKTSISKSSKRPRSGDVAGEACNFLDLEADADSESTSDGDVDEDIRGFINDEELGNSGTPTSAIVHYNPHDMHNELSDEAEIIRARYRQTLTPSLDVDDKEAERYDILENGKLWRVQVKRGFEEESTAFLERRVEREGGSDIRFCFWLPQFPGAIYLIAPSPQTIRHAFERVHTVYTNRDIILVPRADRDALYKFNLPVPVSEGDWVRVQKKGIYKGDIAYVLHADLVNSTVTVLLLPRLSYSKGRNQSQVIRPLPVLFDPNRAREVFGPGSVQGDDAAQSFKFQEMSFQRGFLKFLFPLRQLVIKDVQPTFAEMENFCSYLMMVKPSWDWSRCKWYRDDYLNSLRIGDRIRIEQGEGMGQVGHVADLKEYGVVEVRLTEEINANSSSGNRQLEVPLHHTVRAFKVGDYIRVRHGVHAGIRGHIVGASETTLKVIALQSDNLGLCPDMTQDKTVLSTPFHLEIWKFTASFAQEDHFFATRKVGQYIERSLQTSTTTPLSTEVRDAVEKESEPESMVSGRDPMIGREVLITKGPLVEIDLPRLDGTYGKTRLQYTGSFYSGYFGTIRSGSEGLNVYSVHLEATGKIVDVSRDIVVDRFTRLPLSVVAPPCLYPAAPTPSPAVSSTPMWDSNHTGSTTPAWDPSSRTPLPIQLSTPSEEHILATSSHDLQRGTEVASALLSRPPALPMDWLAMEFLRGKLLKVRFLVDQQPKQGNRRRKPIILPAGTTGRTLGTPISGDPPVIDVKPNRPGFTSIPVLLCDLMPDLPYQRCGFAITGELQGKEIIAVNYTHEVWRVRVADDPEGVVHDVTPDCLVGLCT